MDVSAIVGLEDVPSTKRTYSKLLSITKSWEDGEPLGPDLPRSGRPEAIRSCTKACTRDPKPAALKPVLVTDRIGYQQDCRRRSVSSTDDCRVPAVKIVLREDEKLCPSYHRRLTSPHEQLSSLAYVSRGHRRARIPYCSQDGRDMQCDKLLGKHGGNPIGCNKVQIFASREACCAALSRPQKHLDMPRRNSDSQVSFEAVRGAPVEYE